ncbi:hypothetical protein HYFRA_00011124 [Hymenoscyphus fraxineus]|uniref:Uncharacterized protein n=1 Tax=Hymenoscyphus fraxineus TaxID=746836 RepID=A0A9N9PY90_9HELO|nr:hypothetical protein HYFRA_00011124 [Hymenoscyphus fraxineus]
MKSFVAIILLFVSLSMALERATPNVPACNASTVCIPQCSPNKVKKSGCEPERCICDVPGAPDDFPAGLGDSILE